MKIFTLDLAINCGFAYEESNGPKPKIGAVDLRNKAPVSDKNAPIANLGCFLRDQFIFFKPDLIVIESYLQFGLKGKQGGGTTAQTMLMQIEMAGAVKAVAGQHGVPLRTVPTATWRKHFCGKSTALPPIKNPSQYSKKMLDKMREDRRKANKRMVWDRAVLLGYLSNEMRYNDNKSDAAGIWDWACATQARKTTKELFLFDETPDTEEEDTWSF